MMDRFSESMDVPSNSLIVYDLDSAQVRIWADILKRSTGVRHIAPLPSFSRVMAIYVDHEAAQSAAEAIANEPVRVIFGPAVSLGEEPRHLELPDKGELLFISPPPSPPAGWVSIQEDPPNAVVHFESELTERLRRVVAGAGSNGMFNGSWEAPSGAQGITTRVLLQEGSGFIPAIAVEGDNDDSFLGHRELPKTAMPTSLDDELDN